MKHLLNSIFALLLLFVTILSSGLYANDDKWLVEIELSEDIFVLHQQIWLDVTLTNNTSDTVRTSGLIEPNHRQFFIELRDINGNLMKHTGPIFHVVPGPGRLLLEAGEQDYGSFNIVRLYEEFMGGSGYLVRGRGFPYLPIGTYTIQARYEGVPSNELTTNIVEPSGDEKEVLELIEKAWGVWAKDNSGPTTLMLQQIVDRFPNSVFAERCFYFSRLYDQERKDAMRHGLYDNRILKRVMLENYPNSGSSRSWLWAVTDRLEDDKRIEILNKILEDSPDTRASKFARQMRKRILNRRQ